MASHQQGQDEGPVAHLGDTRAHSLDRPRSSGSRPSLSAHTRPEAGPRNSDVSGTSDFVRATAEHLAEVDSRLKPTRHGSADPTPGFAHIDGDVAGSGTGYNETKVDVVCVTCPGADPVETWTRDPLPDGYFDHEDEDDGGDDPAAAVKASMHNGGAIKELAGDAILSPAINRHLPRAGQLWVRQGIRKYVSTARVMLYRHRELGDGTDIASLADDLLGRVLKSREGLNPSRPLFFIAHSVGGLVVKQALLKSSKDDAYRSILYNCHGVTFFATPHRGSSYLSMKILSQSIQEIMRLQHPLPHSLAHELKLGNPQLQKLHDEFCDIASELQIWTFYETIDSQLSGSGSGWGAGAGAAVSEVQFSAPLCSIKSGLVGVRQEQVYSLDSDHAHCASFGPGNPRTMRSYLHRLAAAVRKAEELSDLYVHTPLRLPEHVKVELVGFYDDPDADAETAVRLYVARYHLAEFMQKGPERCLEERLAKVKRRGAFASMTAGRTRAATEGAEASRSGGNSGLGIWTNVQRMFHPGAAEDSAPPEGPEPQPSPDIVVTRPSPAAASRSLPAEAMRRVQSLTVPPLSTPGFDRPASRASQGTASTMSEPILEETSPKSDRKTAEAETESAIVPVSGTEAKEFDKSQHQQLRAERLSQGSALRDLTAGFSRPDPTQRKFMWIHLPFTNPLWVKDIFNKIGETQRHDFSRLFNTEHWVSKHVQGRHSRSQPSFVKPACNLIPSDPLPSPKPPAGGTTTVSKPRSPRLLYVYLPYLHFDTYLNVLRRRYIVQKRMSHGRARPVPKEIAELESLEARVIWQDQGFDPPLNMRRTLDQFGYPSLQDTYARDDDQMLYKLTKESGPVPPVQRLQQQQQQAGSGSGAPPDKLGSVKRLGSIPLTPGSGDLDGEKAGKKARFDDYVESDIDAEADGYKEGNVLMVDQLWLWAIDTKTLATFFPKRESRPKEGPLFQQADLRNSVYNELNGDLTGHIDNALDLAAFIVLHAVTVLLDRTSHPDLEIFRIFEEAIGLLTERMTSSLKSFRMQTWKQINIDDSDDPDDPEGASSASIKRRHKRELEQAERENREHTSALLELRDLEDELTTLHKLFETQAAVVEAMRNNSCPPEGSGSGSGSGDDGLTAHGRAYLAEALASLDEYRAQTVEMLRRVDTTRKDYEKLLEMAQRQAQVDDVRWSRIQTELASAQNRSIMVFTTFTIIFLPLSFFTSVFGMNTLEWGGESNLPLSTIGSISLPLSAVLIVGSLVAAFSFRVQSVFTRVYRYSKKIVEGGKGYARRLEPQGARDAKARRRVDRERAEYLAARSKDRSYDFWATVRRQRTSEYRIPDVNRKLETGRSTLTPSTWRSKWT